MNAISRPQTILIVEDSDDDYATTQRAFRKAGLSNPVQRCVTGDQALDYLYQRNRHADPATAPRPGIILLDLNLPGTDGREVLARVKADPALRAIPVIVLTTSSASDDVDHCYHAGANTYIQKPVDMQGFIDAILRLKEYWFEVAVLPREDLSA
jgi:two-component system response regulator